MNENNEVMKYLTPISVLLAGGLIALALYSQHSGVGTPSAPAAPGAAAAVNIKNVSMTNEPFIGNANAPVTVVEWSDYQCPYCKQFEQSTLPQIITDYVNAGKVKVVFKDFAFLGQDSVTAGVYDRSVWKLYPAQYFAWRTAMFAAQDAEGDAGFGDAPSIDKLNATVAGLDAAKITADVAANGAAYQAQIDADKAEAGKFGIQGTPAFIIGTTMLPGAYPYANFKTLIDAQLK
jgi:protein-disulfide isomerase